MTQVREDGKKETELIVADNTKRRRNRTAVKSGRR